MLYRPYGKTGYSVSALGMGCMRLPQIVRGDKAQVDKEKAIELIRYAAAQGVTYFDTAFGYHGGDSEAVLGEALDDGSRQRVKIATKQPFRAMETQDTIRRNLEKTLVKLRTDHIDMYLIHNVQIDEWETIKRRRIIEEYEQFKAEGLIRGIGFSYHGKFPGFDEVISYYDWDMCQIQQNFLDTENEATVEGIRRAGKKGCALVIMEPLRGGALATPPPAVQAIYDEYPVKRAAVEWAFRYLADFPEISAILSGVTTVEQLREDVEIFSRPDMVPGCLTEDEREILLRARSQYLSVVSIPCTGCAYCLPCPNGVHIPRIFSLYNDGKMFGTFTQSQRGYFLSARTGNDASRCVACGECEEKCPQHIPIIEQLKASHEILRGWVE
ncbi:MAG: aldo/keto reductase [Spirochaetaceae bacterium]|jgi:predicted aldo/keto reductase-like oxidoreductase|nr:aldo/keto reductase [Spirochaetaceae bacterium]